MDLVRALGVQEQKIIPASFPFQRFLSFDGGIYGIDIEKLRLFPGVNRLFADHIRKKRILFDAKLFYKPGGKIRFRMMDW